MQDRFGLALTTRSAAAREAYVRGLDLMLSGNNGAAALLDSAISADPDFALAHIALARHWQLNAAMAAARECAARARTLAAGASRREIGHVAAIALAIEGRAAEALDAVRGHMREFARDGLVLSIALGVYGLIGFSGRRDHHAEQRALLEALAPHWGEDWWFLGYLGWSLAETGAPAAAAPLLDRALALNPRNANAVHGRAHAFVELGDGAGGRAFLAHWLRDYPASSILHCHLHWHLALFALERGAIDEALQLYDAAIRPAVAASAPMATLADCASLLWRVGLDGGGAAAQRWGEVANLVRSNFAAPGLAFADLHAAMAEAAAPDPGALERRIAAIERRIADNALPQGAVVARLCRGVQAYAAGDDAAAIEVLQPALADLPRIGGSHAQREVFADTLIAACLRAGRSEPARALLAARLARRPRASDEEWLRRC